MVHVVRATRNKYHEIHNNMNVAHYTHAPTAHRSNGLISLDKCRKEMAGGATTTTKTAAQKKIRSGKEKII